MGLWGTGRGLCFGSRGAFCGFDLGRTANHGPGVSQKSLPAGPITGGYWRCATLLARVSDWELGCSRTAVSTQTEFGSMKFDWVVPRQVRFGINYFLFLV